METILLLAKKEIKKDEVIAAASRLVKDNEDDVKGGMTEVSYMLLMELNQRLFELDQIEMELADSRI